MWWVTAELWKWVRDQRQREKRKNVSMKGRGRKRKEESETKYAERLRETEKGELLWGRQEQRVTDFINIPEKRMGPSEGGLGQPWRLGQRKVTEVKVGSVLASLSQGTVLSRVWAEATPSRVGLIAWCQMVLDIQFVHFHLFQFYGQFGRENALIIWIFNILVAWELFFIIN